MKYAWIKQHHAHWPVALQCEVLNVSVSGYHEHHRRNEPSSSSQRSNRITDGALLVQIKAAYAASKGEYGWRRIWKELRANGVRAGKERIRLLMKQHNINRSLRRPRAS